MLIKILINGVLTTCAASVPVASGTYVYLCSEEAKALSHESLSLKLLQKKPAPKVKPKSEPKPPVPSPATGKVSTTPPGSVGVGSAGKGNADSSSGSSLSSTLPSQPSGGSVGSNTQPSPPTIQDAPTHPSPPVSTSSKETKNSQTAPLPASSSLGTSTDKAKVATPTTTAPTTPPINSSPVAEAPKSGITGRAMTISELQFVISLDTSLTEEQKKQWEGVIEKLKTISKDEQQTLLSSFSIS